MVAAVISRLTGFQVRRPVVPAVTVAMVNVEIVPRMLELAVGERDQPMQVDVAVPTGLGIANPEPDVAVQFELDPRPDGNRAHLRPPVWNGRSQTGQ